MSDCRCLGVPGERSSRGLGRSQRYPWRSDETGFLVSLAVRSVKEDGVAIGFPDRGDFDAARTVNAKVDAAGLSIAKQDPFGHFERVFDQLFMMAKGFVDVTT